MRAPFTVRRDVSGKRDLDFVDESYLAAHVFNQHSTTEQRDEAKDLLQRAVNVAGEIRKDHC